MFYDIDRRKFKRIERRTEPMVKILIAFPLDDVYVSRIDEIEGVDAVKATEHQSILKEIEDAEVLYAFRITEEEFLKAKKLLWIHSPFVGVDSLLIDPVRKGNVTVTCSRGIHASQASDHVFALILAFARRLPELLRDQKRRKWKPRHPFPFEPLDELQDKTLGIIGLGSIGREVARKGKCFGMKVAGVKNTRSHLEHVDEIYSPENLERVLDQSDFLVVCVPLTKETAGMIGEKELRKMKRTSYLINIARGGVVDENALIKALRNGWIAGAALDVAEHEPLPESSELWDFDNVIITPHVAGSTPHYWDRAVSIFMENLKRFLSGKELMNVVDKNRGY